VVDLALEPFPVDAVVGWEPGTMSGLDVSCCVLSRARVWCLLLDPMLFGDVVVVSVLLNHFDLSLVLF
jgi:hypothetical protein